MDQHQHAADWAEFDQVLGALPPRLFQQAVVIKSSLTIAYSPTGLFSDILTRPNDCPLPYLHDWLIHDWRLPLSAVISHSLFFGAVYAFMAGYIDEARRDGDTLITEDYAGLQQLLAQQAARQYALLFAEDAPFWIGYQQCWQAYAEAQLWQPELPNTASWQADYFTWLDDRSAPVKLPLIAATHLAGQIDQLPGLQQLLDCLHIALQLRAEVMTVRRDLKRRRLTYPIGYALLAAHIDPRGPYSADRVLGAMLLSGSFRQVCEEALTHLAQSRTLAQGLHLPTFEAYLALLEDDLRALQELFTLKSTPKTTRLAPAFAPAVDSLATVTRMAEGYLLADRSFRESWEVQRRGPQDLIGIAFPVGLIAEVLCQHGHAMSDVVDEVFAALQGSGFRYYTAPIGVPDTDDLGSLLRLLPYATQPDVRREILREPLRWLENSITATGLIPVWLTADSDAPPVRVWGSHCATVEANLLLGLISYDWTTYQSIIERSSRQWLERWRRDGLGATAYYVPVYSLWTALKLLKDLGNRLPAWQSEIEETTSVVVARLEIESNRAGLTPQTAALLRLACAHEPARHLLDPRWLTLLLKTQRYDGSWPAEALYLTPTRGEFATWYASQTVTTAFCYHALKAA